MNRKLFYLFILLFSVLSTEAQLYQKDEEDLPDSRPQKVGVRLGLGRNWLYAPEMEQGNGQFGLQGAVYYRLALNKRVDLNFELGGSYRGSRFSPKDTTGYYYSRLGLFFLDLPVQAIISLDKGKKNNLMFGPRVSYLLKPSLFVREDYFPTFTNLPIKKWEFSGCFGYMYNTQLVGFYIGYKHGFSNLAGDFARFNITRDLGTAMPYEFHDIKPSLETVKNLFTRSFEISLYF